MNRLSSVYSLMHVYIVCRLLATIIKIHMHIYIPQIEYIYYRTIEIFLASAKSAQCPKTERGYTLRHKGSPSFSVLLL